MSASTSRFKVGFSVLLVLVLANSSLSFAQSRYNPGDGLSLKLGETDLFPSIRLDYLANSNAFLSAENPTEASDLTISPTLTWVADRRLFYVVGQYSGAYNVSSEEALNYADHLLSVNANAELDSRKRLKGEVKLEFGHESLGTNLTRGDADEDSDQVEYIQFSANSEFRYGAAGAKGNIVAGLDLANMGFASREDVTDGRDFLLFEPYAQFSYRLGGDTRLLTELRFASVTFDDDDRDRNDISLLGGIEFAATGKTGGFFKAGVVQSQPKSSARTDQTEFVFSADLYWEPTSFSRLTLTGYRAIDNTGSSLVVPDEVESVRNVLGVRWNHNWSSRVSSLAVVTSDTRTNACPEPSANTLNGRLEFNVQINRWLTAGVNGNYTTRAGDICAGDTESADLDYDRSRVGAHLKATL